MRKKVVLVHGYNKNQRDMLQLKHQLESLGYQGILVNLPLTYQTIEHCSMVFETKIATIISGLGRDEKLCFVGHSTGGLIIRHFLANTNYTHRIDRSVLIATPNQGSQLAYFAAKLPRFVTNIYKTLNSLHPDNVRNLKLNNPETLEIGAIAGSKSDLFLGKLIQQENDGRVEVSSVHYRGLKDFIVIPYGHKEIHQQLVTAELVDSFLRTGRFK